MNIFIPTKFIGGNPNPQGVVLEDVAFRRCLRSLGWGMDGINALIKGAPESSLILFSYVGQ